MIFIIHEIFITTKVNSKYFYGTILQIETFSSEEIHYFHLFVPIPDILSQGASLPPLICGVSVDKNSFELSQPATLASILSQS